MKQNISSEQLNELSDKGKEKLGEWHTEKHILWRKDLHISKDGKRRTDYYLAQLSIGQMIEFLGDRSHGVLRNYRHQDYADALWEACKGKLE